MSATPVVYFHLKRGRGGQVLIGTKLPREFAAGIAKALEAHQPPH